MVSYGVLFLLSCGILSYVIYGVLWFLVVSYLRCFVVVFTCFLSVMFCGILWCLLLFQYHFHFFPCDIVISLLSPCLVCFKISALKMSILWCNMHVL